MWQSIAIDVLVMLVAFGFGLYLNRINKGVNVLKELIERLTGKVGELDITVKKHSETIKDIALVNSVMGRIDMKVKQALEYIPKDDITIQSFIMRQGELAKECIEWAIHTKMKVSVAEVQAKYETCNIEVRDLLIKTDPMFSQNVRPALFAIMAHHVQRVTEIATDELFNSKIDRFLTLTEQTVNEVLTSIVRTRIENEIKINK